MAEHGATELSRKKRLQNWARLEERVLIDGRLVGTRPGLAHGTRSTYVNWGCRCVPCTEAHTAAALRRRARRAARPRSEVPHGTNGGYTNWGCRCRPCIDAGTATAAAYRRDRRG